MINLTGYTNQNLQAQMLAQVSDKYDKRDTSPIQTAIGPAAYALEEYYMNLDLVQKGGFISTAKGDDLDQLAVIGNVAREPASPAVRLGVFDQSIPNGARFSTVNGSNSINFVCTSGYTRSTAAAINQSIWEAMGLGTGTFVFTYDEENWIYDGNDVSIVSYGITLEGNYIRGDTLTVVDTGVSLTVTPTQTTDFFAFQLTAETAGTIGNDYSGPILPISVIPDLTYAYIADILVLGDDEENDDELRERLIEALTVRPFGGNITAYRQAAMAIDGVGAVQVYPTWDGGGTVKLSILGSDYLPASNTVVANVQNEIDPPPQGSGMGMAPIGAVVTVVAPTSVSVNIVAVIDLSPGVTIDQVRQAIIDAIGAYILSVRKEWDTQVSAGTYSSTVYRSRVMTAILSVAGVVNVSTLTLNGSASDLVLTESGVTQQVPVEGTVSISE